MTISWSWEQTRMSCRQYVGPIAAQPVGKFESIFHVDTTSSAQVQWLGLLEWEDMSVIPAEVLSPLGLYALKEGRRAQVGWHQTGQAVTVLEHAARQCF